MMSDQNPIIIFGAQQLGKIALDILLKNEIDIYGFLDDDTSIPGRQVNDIPILGTSEDKRFLALIGEGCDAFVALDDAKLSKHTVQMLYKTKKIRPVNALDFHAVIAHSVVFGYGNMVMAKAVLQPNVRVGNCVIISSGSVISVESQIADNVVIKQNVSVGNQVKIGENAYIGAGSVLIDGVVIGKNASIGAGSVVISSVKDNEKVFGNPAKPV